MRRRTPWADTDLPILTRTFDLARLRRLIVRGLTAALHERLLDGVFDVRERLEEARMPGIGLQCEDLLLVGSERRRLRDWRIAIERRLATLRLTIHEGAHPRPASEGFPFLGFTVFPHLRRLKRREVVHARRRFARLLAAYRDGSVTRQDVAASVKSWLNHARYGNTVGLRKAVLRDVVL